MNPLPHEPELAQALRRLPHGREFRFLDALEALDPGKRGTARYQVRGDEPFLAAHFPGQPMLPGVILIEAIAQLGGVICQCDPCHPVLENLRLTAVRNAKILGAPSPGDTLFLSACVEGRMTGLVQISGEVRMTTTAGETAEIATARVTLSGDFASGDRN